MGYNNLLKMSIEQAVLRRIRLGQSFCCYNFKVVRSSNGSIVAKANFNRQNSTIHTQASNLSKEETIEHLKEQKVHTQQPSRRSSLEKDVYPRKKPQLKKIKSSSSPFLKGMRSENHSNRLQEYLSDYFSLKQANNQKLKQFTSTPSTDSEVQKGKVLNKSMRPFSALHKFNYKKYREVEVKTDFDASKYPEFFFDFIIDDNQTKNPFVDFVMVCLNSKKYIHGKIGERMFSEIPMKQYQRKLNDFSVEPENCLFYIALRKQKKEGQILPYTEGFFWISQPIKHTQRADILDQIKKYTLYHLNKCILHYPQLVDRLVSQKLWIVDFNGKMSHLDKQYVLTCLEQDERNNFYKDFNFNEVTISKFLNNFKRGIFTRSNLSSSSGHDTPRTPLSMSTKKQLFH